MLDDTMAALIVLLITEGRATSKHTGLAHGAWGSWLSLIVCL
jgi:hypothetical protein